MNKKVEEFGWIDEEKEFYFRIAEERIERAGAEEKVDRRKFKIAPEGVYVSLLPFRKGSKAALRRWNKLKKIQGFQESKEYQFDGRKDKKYYHGEIKIAWRRMK